MILGFMQFISGKYDIHGGWKSRIVRFRSSFAALSISLIVASSVSAQATTPVRKCSKTRSRNAIESIASKLASNSEKAVFAAIDELGTICHPLAVEKLTALIREGQPDAVTDYVLETLGKTGSSHAVEVLKQFTNHRRADARRIAYRALAAIRSSSTIQLLSQGLRDTNAEVRATTALLLGEVGSPQQLDILFWAFSRGVPEAAVAIGQLGDTASIERFTEYLEKKPLPIMLSGYEQFLLRDDLTEAAKLKIVTVLGEVSGPVVREFLMSILSREKRENPSALIRSIRATIGRIPSKQLPSDRPPSDKSGK